MSDLALETHDLGKRYRVYDTDRARAIELATLRRWRGHRELWALRHVNLSLEAGTVLGVCGSNGAGKSTFLKLLTRTTPPSEGRFRVRGSVRSLLELGVGFRWDLSGRENLRDQLRLLGTSARDLGVATDQAIEFSELGEDIDRPLRTYSSGMAMRLGFSVAAALDPDVLILDEVFAVGDVAFQRKCIDRIRGFKADGRTVILCSHSIYDLRHFCDEVVWLDGGRVAAHGDPVETTAGYLASSRETNGTNGDPGGEASGPAVPHLVVVRATRAGSDEPLRTVSTGETVELRVEWTKPDDDPRPLSVGAGLIREDNVIGFGLATHFDDLAPLRGSHGIVRLRLPELQLLSGRYTVAARLFDASGTHCVDELAADDRLEVTATGPETGVYRPTHDWIVEEGE